MLVVHGLWLAGGRLALWAEDSTLPAQPPRRPGRAPRERPHPFAAAHATLIEALGEAASKATTSGLLLTLPTRGGAPVDSPELVRAEPAAPGRAALTLAGWRAPALECDPDDALPLLRALGSDPTGIGPTAIAAVARGASLRHLAELAGLAADLVARGRTLPGLDGERAVWRPLLTGADARWARAQIGRAHV